LASVLDVFDELHFDSIRVSLRIILIEQSVQQLYIAYQLALKFESTVNCFNVGQFNLGIFEIEVEKAKHLFGCDSSASFLVNNLKSAQQA